MSTRLVRRPCEGCGEMFALDETLYAGAMHDCESGSWLTMRRDLAEALRAMSDEEAAEWCGVPVEDIRRVRDRR